MSDFNSRNIIRKELEIVSKENPINIPINYVGKVIGIELESFYYTITNPSVRYLGININGLKGKYNELGNQIACIQTIPYDAGSSSYKFQSTSDNDVLKLSGGEPNLYIQFVNREITGINPSLIPFSNNYLLNLSLYIET